MKIIYLITALMGFWTSLIGNDDDDLSFLINPPPPTIDATPVSDASQSLFDLLTAAD